MGEKENNEEYGYPSLAKISLFLRRCIGDIPLIEIEKILEEKHIHTFKEKGSITKSWDRICKDDYKLYQNYRFDSEDGIIFFVKSFLFYMHKEYGLSEPIISLILSTYSKLYNLIPTNPYSQIPTIPDIQTKEIVKTILFYNVTEIVFDIEQRYKNWKELLDYYFSDCLTYEAIISLIKEKSEQTWESIYDQLDKKVQHDKIRNKNEGADRFEKIIKKCIKDNENPTWENFWILFEWVPGTYKISLLEVYLLNNFKTSLINTFNLSYEELRSIKSDLIAYLTNGDEKIILTKYNVITYKIKFAAVASYLDILKEPILYLNKKNEYFNNIKQAVIKTADNNNTKINCLFDFFEPWLKGYISVAEKKFGYAQKYYKEAFEHKYLAGDYILPFLKQAFVLEMYCNGDWIKARKAADPETDNKSPLCEQAQIYWNYGYALNFFEKPATEAFLESFRIYQNFYNEFPPEICEHPENAKQIYLKEIAVEYGILIEESNDVPSKKLDKLYGIFVNLTDCNQINDRFNHPLAPKDDKEKRLYSYLSLCIILGTRDTRFLDLAEKWINYNNIKVGVRNFNNSTALLEALTQYKHLKYAADKSKINLINRYRKLIFKIIEKSKLEDLCETKIHKFHVLQIAIDAYDIEIIEAMLNKGLDINTLRIDADELSPLYYVVNRRCNLTKGYTDYINKQEKNLLSITWKNSDRPGITAYDKQINDNIFFNRIDINQKHKLQKTVFEFLYGNEKVKNEQLTELNKIINLFISKTSDLNSFIKVSNNQQGISVLDLAGEFDDVELCKIFLEKGVDPIKPKGDIILCSVPTKYGYYEDIFYDISFVSRLIFFKSWNMLEDFLVNYTDIAKKSMTPNEYGITPLIFFIMNLRKEKDREVLYKKFIPLFKKAGAKMNQQSYIGSANYLLKQIKNNKL